MAYDGTLKFDTSIDTSGFSDGIEKIGSAASTALKATSAIVTGAATAIVGIGTAATKVGMDFEASMSNVAAISGATGNELQALTAKQNSALRNPQTRFLIWRWPDGKPRTCLTALRAL